MKKLGSPSKLFVCILLFALCAAACSQVPDRAAANPDLVDVQFSGEQALAQQAEFVTKFPNRDSGQQNNQRAADWLFQQFSALGLSCSIDQWQVINHSRPLPLRNVICRLPGESERPIVLMAHHDQSPKTIQGADNDASGIAIMLQLARIFAAEDNRPYSLLFVAADGEEWGMLGSQRFIQSYPDPEQVIAAVSLDNLGKKYYGALEMDPTGQYRGMGALWLQLLAQDAAAVTSDLQVPRMYSPLGQLISQAVPISKMDNGPLVAAGVPAFGFTGLCPADAVEQCWETFHTPDDTMKHQSADSLYQAGGSTEVLVRQLFSQRQFPQEAGPYLYLEEQARVIRGAPLWAGFGFFVALFFAAAGWQVRRARGTPGKWRAVLVHFLALWLPMIAAILLLYLLVEIGLMDKWDTYPSTSKGDPIYNPRWPAVMIWLASLSILLRIGRRLGARVAASHMDLEPARVKSLALGIVGLGGIYVLLSNPFSLFLMLPMLAWLLIGLRRGLGRVLDILLFLLGGMLIIYMFYVFGFGFLRNDYAILWYVMMMFSIRMVSFKSALAITAMFAAGLSMLVNPPQAAAHQEKVAATPVTA